MDSSNAATVEQNKNERESAMSDHYRPIPPETPLSGYRVPELKIECARCRRNAASLQTYKLARRYGTGITIGDLVRAVAGSGRKACGLVAEGQCSARAWEPPVWMWATLDDALKGGWWARLHCMRHTAALKRVQPCPEVTLLDTETLHASFGYDFPLARLQGKIRCRHCNTNVTRIEWVVPNPVPPPYSPAAAEEPPLRLKPSRAQQGRRRFRVIDGGV
jgi:hypothetical protein